MGIYAGQLNCFKMMAFENQNFHTVRRHMQNETKPKNSLGLSRQMNVVPIQSNYLVHNIDVFSLYDNTSRNMIDLIGVI